MSGDTSKRNRTRVIILTWFLLGFLTLTGVFIVVFAVGDVFLSLSGSQIGAIVVAGIIYLGTAMGVGVTVTQVLEGEQKDAAIVQKIEEQHKLSEALARELKSLRATMDRQAPIVKELNQRLKDSEAEKKEHRSDDTDRR